MPLQISLEMIPSQEIQFTHERVRFSVLIRQLNAHTCVAQVSRDGELIVPSLVIVPNRYLIPTAALDRNLGNFYIATPLNELPDYRAFGRTQHLIFVTAEELLEVRRAG